MDKTQNGKSSSTFNNLAKDLSSAERKAMLSKLSPVSSEISQDSQIVNKIKGRSGGTFETNYNFRREPFFTRLVIWFKAMFLSESVEDVYSSILVSNLAKSVEWDYPELIIYKKKLLYIGFYENLFSLKKAADFFRPYIQKFESDEGSFYLELSRIIIPGIVKQIEEESDPYKYSFTVPMSSSAENELRAVVVKTLESIPSDKQRDMYQYAQMLFWLKAFVNLPFNEMIEHFFVVSDKVRACFFSNVRDKVLQMAQVLANYVHIDERIIGTFVLFMQETYEILVLEDVDERSSEVKNFRDCAISEISFIEMFIKDTPMEKIAKIVSNNYFYTVKPFGGGEKWFDDLSATVKKNFELRLQMWQNDYQKDRLKIKLFDYFQLTTFPLFPFRPWDKLWNGIRFDYEYSIGMVNYFVKKMFPNYEMYLKGISMEGDFSVRENRQKLSVIMDNMEQVNAWLDKLANDLSAAGEYGSTFSKYEGMRTRTKGASNHINMVMGSVNSDSERIIKAFVTLGVEMIRMIKGFRSEKMVGQYGSLLNLGTILRRFGDFPLLLENMAVELERVVEIVRTLQQLEIPVAQKKS